MTRTKVSLRRAVRSQHTGRVTRLVLLALLLLACSAGAAEARGTDHGGGGDTDVRVDGDCGRGATSSLRIRAHDGIETRFQVRETRGRGVWQITIVHENRVAARATGTTTRADDSFELRRTLQDFPGSDTVVVHAWGPLGLDCRATATLPDSG
jgi:hypothetical protein